MRFPKQRLRFTLTHDGKPEERGYIVLDLKGLDIEGVNSLAVRLEDIETARGQGDKQEDAAKKARELLGG